MDMTRRAFLVAGLGLLVSPAYAYAANLFTRTDGYSASGEAINGLLKIDSKMYCYQAGEKLVDKEFKYKGDTYRAGTGDGALLKEAWYPDAKTVKRSWFKADYKKLLEGEFNTGGNWYYVDKSTGQIITGWKDLSDKRVYYDTNTGAMVHGELCLGDHEWYYMDNASGALTKGWRFIEDKKNYPERGGKWCYYDTNSGKMLYGQQVLPENNDAGAATHWYYLDDNTGAVTYGFKTLKQGRVFYERTAGYMLYGWHDIDGGTYHFQEQDGHEISWTERGTGASEHVHDAQAMAELAVRCAVTCDGYSNPIKVNPDGSNPTAVWQPISNSTAQEYIKITNRVTKQYHTNDGDSDNPAYASCTQAVAHIARACVDPNMESNSTGQNRIYMDNNPQAWKQVGFVGKNDNIDNACQPGDILVTDQDSHTFMYVGNALVRKMYPNSTANCFEADVSTGQWPHLSTRVTYPHLTATSGFRIYRYQGSKGNSPDSKQRDQINCWRYLGGA